MGVGFAHGRAGRRPQRRRHRPYLDAVAKAVGDSDDLLVVKLDVTSRQHAEAAVKATLERFGGIDVQRLRGSLSN